MAHQSKSPETPPQHQSSGQDTPFYAERLEVISRITRAIVGTAPFATLANDIAQQVRQAFGVDACVIRTCEDDELVLLGSAGIPDANLHTRIKAGWGISERIMEERHPIFIPDVHRDPATSPYIGTLPLGYRFTSYAGVPLLADERVIGILGLYTSELMENLTLTDLDHLQLIANHIAVAVFNERLYQELKIQRDRLEREIQDRQRIEEALQHNQTLYRLITENTRDMICILDSEARVVYASPSVSKVLGYSLEAFVGSSLVELLHSEDIPRLSELFEAIMEGEQATAIYRLRHADGSYVWMEGQGGRIELDGVPHLLKTSRDISERRLLEEQLAQAQKMESIGRLAGGIAHDFNNLLTAIIGYNQFAQLEVSADNVIAPYLTNVNFAAQKAAALTRQMLAFARRQPINPQIINLNDLLVNLDHLLRRLIGADIELVTLPDTILGQALADAHQFEQVIINLAVNARDAMPEGGKLTLRTGNATVMRPAVLPHGEMPAGEYVLLSVSDTGVGMTDDVKQRIFEPFFTTKEVGKGTGLGLATCYGVIKQSGGHIVVESKPNKGTTFAIYLPRVYATGAKAVVTVEENRPLYGVETVLLVEDEASVRAIAAKALRNVGYTVHEAPHGEEALRLVRGRETQIDLLITDVIMPRMGGRELSERLVALHPNIKVLFMSGYTEPPSIVGQDIAAQPFYLQKPFTPQVLMQKVREVLESSVAKTATK